MTNKKQDLKLVFEFIADFLREETPVTPEVIVPVNEEPIDEPVEEPAKAPKTKIDVLIDSINPEEVRGLMQRVDEMDKPTFMGNPLIGEHQRNFEAEFKKMVSQVDKLTKEKAENDRNVIIDATAKSDFDVIKSLRNNITAEERELARPTYGTLEEVLRRARTGVSFSG